MLGLFTQDESDEAWMALIQSQTSSYRVEGASVRCQRSCSFVVELSVSFSRRKRAARSNK